jgi:DNA-binding beta-propeller fold protein YncE
MGTKVANAEYEVVEGWEKAPEGLIHWDVGDVAVDSRDRVYLLARHDNRVCIYDREGNFIRSWGEGNSLIGYGGHGIAVDRDFNVYVVDWLQHCVTKFNEEGEVLFILGTPGVGADNGIEPWPPKELAWPVERLSRLHSTGPFNGCTKAAIAPNGDLYVSDGYGNARIHHFTSDGKLIESWGEPGSGPGQFHNPHGLEISPDGLLYVSDRENDRVQVFSLDFEFVREFNVQHPCDAAVDYEGRIAVCELRYWPPRESFTRGTIKEFVPDRLSVLDQEGNVLFRDENMLMWPNGVAVDSHGDLYVAQVVARVGSQPNPVAPDAPSIVKVRRKR